MPMAIMLLVAIVLPFITKKPRQRAGATTA